MILRSEPVGEPWSRPGRKGVYQLHRFIMRTERPTHDRDTGLPTGYIVFYDWYVKDVKVGP